MSIKSDMPSLIIHLIITKEHRLLTLLFVEIVNILKHCSALHCGCQPTNHRPSELNKEGLMPILMPLPTNTGIQALLPLHAI